MAYAYVLILDPNDRCEKLASFHNPAGENGSPVLYIGFTNTSVKIRVWQHTEGELMTRSYIRGSFVKASDEVTNLFGNLYRSKAGALEGWLFKILKESGYRCLSDAQLLEEGYLIVKCTENPYVDYAAVVKSEQCESVWDKGIMTIKNGGIYFDEELLEDYPQDLVDTINFIRKAFGLRSNGRFTLNDSGQIILKLDLVGKGIDQTSSFVCGFIGDSVVAFQSKLIFPSGIEFGRNDDPEDVVITRGDIETELPLVDLGDFEKFKDSVLEILDKEVKDIG